MTVTAPLQRPLKYRPKFNAKIVSETTATKTVKLRGTPVLRHTLVVVYRLNCGHTITRTTGRDKDARHVGARMCCEHCGSEQAETHP